MSSPKGTPRKRKQNEEQDTPRTQEHRENEQKGAPKKHKEKVRQDENKGNQKKGAQEDEKYDKNAHKDNKQQKGFQPNVPSLFSLSIVFNMILLVVCVCAIAFLLFCVWPMDANHKEEVAKLKNMAMALKSTEDTLAKLEQKIEALTTDVAKDKDVKDMKVKINELNTKLDNMKSNEKRRQK